MKMTNGPAKHRVRRLATKAGYSTAEIALILIQVDPLLIDRFDHSRVVLTDGRRIPRTRIHTRPRGDEALGK